MNEQWHLAQINIGNIRYPIEHPRMRGFVDQLDAVNALAEASPGFIWRLEGESGNATDVEVTDDPTLLANMSVWRRPEDLFDFVYKTVHRDVMTLRRHWFERPTAAYQTLWWVPAGHRPSVDEGLERIYHLREHGPTPRAFTFQNQFPPEGDGSGDSMHPEDYCSGWD